MFQWISKEKAIRTVHENITNEQRNDIDTIAKIDESNEDKEQSIAPMDVSQIHDNDLFDLEMLNKYEYYPLDLSYDDNDNYITSISGVFSDIKVCSSEDALCSLYSVKTLIGLDDPKSQLVLDMEDESDTDRYYTFEQYYHKIKVWGTIVTVSADDEGKTCSLQSMIVPEETLSKMIPSTTPKISEAECKRIVEEHYDKATDIAISLVLYANDINDDFRLAYYCIAGSKNDISYGMAAFIDANTGEFIYENTTNR